ncbi:ABC transporter transmembrane domain-containing protein [Paenirhodobacter enshiensis]|uniref:ABC transporter ATPase n=1 Tax=Paenirhodobacter enshiensis TaxID=1105367 RepID=A0A086XXQ3_9RHOB|nr:ABC transporter ATP-binding protein [Paenirhodobacter enshiensis]KFI26803.1 ABC transporter ATPase [Paenirhodobacter enshiensis]
MDKSLTRYIWTHTRREQIWVLAVVLLSMIPYYLSFDLPKQIVNGPIQGMGFTEPGATQRFLHWAPDIPLIGKVELFPGLDLDRMGMLIALSLTFLGLVVVNGVFKLYINTFKGRMGERLLRRIRYELVDRLLRFPPAQFRRLKPAEAASMIKDEVEPLGGFTGDAFVQPLMLGGQALAALLFILMQSLWLGALAGGIAAVQGLIIPRMRRRLIALGRERQLTARQLSGRVNEIMDGIVTVHALDTTNLERADLSRRLGEIFRIRYDLYQWKFMVKFLNNFLAQVTPFVFYLLGGWLTIRGTLDVGQLVAVINAYKELPGPLKELIDWDQARQDVEVKYEQVVEQFRVDELIPETVQRVMPGLARLPGPLNASSLVLRDDSGNLLLDHTTLHIGRSETVALVDDHGGGAEAFAAAIGRAIWPASGKLAAGDVSLLELPEGVAGRQITYVPAEGYFFYGSLLDNLLYGLRHAPGPSPRRSGATARQFQWCQTEARAAGNPPLDMDADWLDVESVAPNARGAHDIPDAVMAALSVTEMQDDILGLGLMSHVDPLEKPDLTRRLVEIRHALRAGIDAGRIDAHVVPFERDRYNEEATIAENLLFGTLEDPMTQMPRIIQSPEVRSIMMRGGLAGQLFDLGLGMATTLLELLGDDPAQDVLLNDLPYLTMEDIPDLRQLVLRVTPGGLSEATRDDRMGLIRLAMFYVEPVQRFGLMTPELARSVVEARNAIHREISPELRAMIEPYDPMRYMRSATLMENVLFGKSRDTGTRAGQSVRAAVVAALDEAGLTRRVMELGLGVNIGVGGRRLSLAQRQKLNIARALIRQSEYYVFDKSLSAVDPRTQERIVCAVVATVTERGDGASVIWVLTNTRLAHLFGRIIMFDRGRVVADGGLDTVSAASGGSGIALS